ncbi:hypothetical protein ACXYMO_18195 [Arenibacterium sp. CAU 1754]
MSISGPQFRTVYEQLLAAYGDINDLDILLSIELGIVIDDVSPTTGTRKRRILDVVTKARSQGWISGLINAVLNDSDQASNVALSDALTPILAILEPEPGVPAFNHLTTDGVAFANRRSLRQTIGDMTLPDGPRALVLRGHALSGTSYAWRLLNHVARDGAIERVRIDFEQAGDHSPMGVALSLAAEMQIAASPERSDNPSQEQLAAYLVRWLSGHLRNSTKTWWIVFDNAHLVTVPPETKEMIVAFARHFSSGSVDTVRVFILGFDSEIGGIAPPFGFDVTLSPIGRPELVDYLTEAKTKLGDLPGFADVDEAVDEVLADLDLSEPTREVMNSITQQLTHIVAEMRQS